MMANISLRILFAHWLAFLGALQQFFWNCTPQSLLSTVFPELIEDSSKFSSIVHVPRIRDPYGSVDLATICFVPAILRTPLPTNFSCSVDRPDYGLDDASSPESSHHYVLLDIPVWQPAVPDEDIPPKSPSTQDDYTQTNMAPYGARGLSFCPVLVGVVYIQSLLHLYMLLMIPSLFNHWFEDVLIYDSLNPIELLDCSWFLHTSLWMVPWHLLRYGVRKTVPCLYRQIRQATYKSAHPPIPRIVLIRVNGEAVPVNLVEEASMGVDVGVWTSFEAANLKMNDGQDATSDSGEPQDFMQSLISAGKSCIATEFEARHQGGVAETQNGMGLGPLASEFAEDLQSFVNQIPDEQLQIPPFLVETTNEPQSRSVEKDIIILSIPGSDNLVSTPCDCDVDEPTGEFEQMEFLEAVVDDVRQDGTDSLGEREASDQDPITFSPWSLIDDYGPDESETLQETLKATSSFIGLQVTPTSMKNVRFAIGDGAGAADRWQASLSASDENTCPWNLGSQLGNDGVALVQTPVVPFGPSMDRQDATPPEQLIKPVFPKVLSDERVEGNDVVLAESPSLTEKPIVNLPSLMIRREDMRSVEWDPMIPAALIEDVATRSPLEIHSPFAPVVVINMNCIIEVEEQGLTPLGTEELDQGWPHAGHMFGTLGGKGAAGETLDIVFPQEDRCPPSSSIEDSNSVCSPIVNCEPSLGGIQTLDIALSTSATASEIGMPVATNNLVVTNTSPSAAREVPGKNAIGVEILYETPRYYSDGTDLAKSLRNGLRGPEVRVPDATSTKIHLPAVSESPKEPDMEDQVGFVAAEKSDSMTITLTGQHVGPSCAFVTEFPTTELSELISALPVTCKEASPLSMISAEKKFRELDHGKSHEADTIPCSHRTISKPLQERTLSGSMHAPAESLPIPQTDSPFSRTSVLYETPPSVTQSVSLAGPEGGTSMITETPSKREEDLSASIHAPQRISKPEVQSSISQSRDESNRDRRRSVTNPVVVSERRPLTKPCPPDWTAMPEVVDAFRMFKRAPSASIAECTNRGPMLAVVGQKGIATNSLNNISATANIQNRWMHRSGLLLVRDLVSSDPADFNLRPCTNLRTPKMNAMPVQQAGMLDIPPYVLQHGITPCPFRVNVDVSSMVAGSTGIQRQQSMMVPRNAEIGTMLGYQHWMAYRS